MKTLEPDWDINLAQGAQSELWVGDLRKALAERASIEVKADKPLLKNQHCYVEYQCLHKDGKWHKSGIARTKASLYIFQFGCLPGALVVETEWLKRAARLAWRRPSARAECQRGSHPTRGVLVSLADLWKERSGEP